MSSETKTREKKNKGEIDFVVVAEFQFKKKFFFPKNRATM